MRNITIKLILCTAILCAVISTASSQHLQPTADTLSDRQRRECLRYRADAERFFFDSMQKDTIISLNNDIIISKDKKIRNRTILASGLAAAVIRLGIKSLFGK